MPEIEINGKKLTVEQGSTVMDAANASGTYIPHFCYHKKLSIAANCRMCLVEVEKAPKPLPACATPVADGMKVFTHSEKAKAAQRGVMEFLLINHPLDCPVCDQGGECQLQDLAVGYGGGASRYIEEKRAVPGKDMGPLIAAEEMSRCIHCTRCIRFTDEIAGFQEIGMANRTEHSEILPFLGKTVNSEISGNVIDLCPVGALTSKPFRFSARPWELSRRKSIAPHDGLGSNLIVQVKCDQVKRVLPLENEDINECWLSDRDRFSYEALNSAERLQTPMIKHGGEWHKVDWPTALAYVAKALNGVAAEHGKDAIGALANPIATTEELYLLQKLMRGFGVRHIDSRLRRSDFRSDATQQGAFWLGSSLGDLMAAQSVLVVGSTLRQEQPLLAARIRQAVKKGMQLNVVHSSDDDLLTMVQGKLIVAPDQLVNALAQILKAVLVEKDGESAVDLSNVQVSDSAKAIAASLAQAERSAVVLGQVAQHHPAFSEMLHLAQEISRISGASCGLLAEAGNSVGAELAGAVPHHSAFGAQVESGDNAMQMFTRPRKAYVLFHTEPEADCYDGAVALAALNQAETVIALTAFKGDGLLDYADVLLPVSPFTETAGSFVNMEGREQSFYGVVHPLGETRPGWKVLRVLGNMLTVPGFDYQSIDEIRAEMAGLGALESALNNRIDAPPVQISEQRVDGSLQRIGEIPLYHGDALTRRAGSLQLTIQAAPPVAALHPDTLSALGLADGDLALLMQGGAEIRLPVKADRVVPAGAVRVPGAHPATQGLGGLFEPIEMKRG